MRITADEDAVVERCIYSVRRAGLYIIVVDDKVGVLRTVELNGSPAYAQISITLFRKMIYRLRLCRFNNVNTGSQARVARLLRRPVLLSYIGNYYGRITKVAQKWPQTFKGLLKLS